MNYTTNLAHRGGIDLDPIQPNPTMLNRMGGRQTVEHIVHGLYDRIEQDPLLRPMFNRNLAQEREKQVDFWVEWFGGAPKYTQHHAYSGLRVRHAALHITPAAAEQWLAHLTAALEAAVDNTAQVQEVLALIEPMARSFVNETTPPARAKDLRCGRARPLRRLKPLAEKGRTADLLAELKAQPPLATDPLTTAELLQSAAAKGRTETVAALLNAGVNPNQAAPFKEGCIFQPLMITSLCAALVKGHKETAACLEQHGALYDVFTAAYLGNLGAVVQLISTYPTLANATDPATDLLPSTPLHHAVYGGHLAIAEFLFEQGATVSKNSTPMIKHAANNHHLALTRLLLKHHADATRLGPGPWVLNKDLADLLVNAGADVNYPKGEWIWRSCTGNNSQRDHPSLVQGLLEYGADIHTRLRGATALHYAAKAGFLATAQVLLTAGANPNALNNAGETPLFYALKAGKRADIAAICTLLLTAGAHVQHTNKKGATLLTQATQMQHPDREKILLLLKEDSTH